MFDASPMAVMELSRIERMSDLEIVEEAQKEWTREPSPGPCHGRELVRDVDCI